MRERQRSLVPLALAGAMLSACSGAGVHSSSIPQRLEPAIGTAATGWLTIMVSHGAADKIRKSFDRVRKPLYISAATMQAALFIDGATAAAGSSASCSSGCTIAYSTAAGSHTFRAEISNGSSAILAEGAQSVTVLPGSGNNFTITLNGTAILAAWISTTTTTTNSISGTYEIEDSSSFPITSSPAGASTAFDNAPITFSTNLNNGFSGTASFTTSGSSTMLSAPDAAGNDYPFTATCSGSANGIFTISATTGSSAAGLSVGQLSGQSPVLGYPPSTLNVAQMHPYLCTNGTIADGTAHGFVYATNLNSNNLSGFAINATTGALTQIAGSPFATGTEPYGLVATPNGAFLYVDNNTSNNVFAFAVNATTGALTTIVGSPYATASGPRNAVMAATSGGWFLYVVNQSSNNVSAYSINQSTGALTTVAGSPFVAATNPLFSAVSPNGAFLYVTNANSNTVSAYAISASTGVLTQVSGSPFATGSGPRGSAVTPDGAFLYVGNGGTTSGTISAYTINAATGALTQIPGSPFTAGNSPRGMAISPNGAFLYVGNGAATGDNTVSAFTINATTGALTQLSGSPFTASPVPFEVAVDATNSFLYITNANVGGGASSVSAFTINASTGALTAIAGSPFAAGNDATAITVLR